MKNRLLLALFFLLNLSFLQAQVGTPMTVILQPLQPTTCGCDGCFVVTIINGQAPYVYQWSNGISSTSAATPITQCGFCPGLYTVTVSNPNSNQTATATGVIMNSPPIPIEIVSLNPAPCNMDSITGGNQDCEQVCAGATSTYSLSGLNSPSSTQVMWQVNGASSWVVEPPLGNRITVTWGNSGTGSIVAIATDLQSQGCTSEDYLCITILEPPTAKITSAPIAPASGILKVCKGQMVDFQDISAGDVDYVEWFFSDNSTNSTASNPQHTFFNPGIHTVTLVAKSNCLCVDTTTLQVEVLDAVAPTLDCVATICPGETVTYTSANACPPFSWTVSPNGTILEGGVATSDSITVQWGDGPHGTISLGAAACSGATCPIEGVINIPIVSDNAEIRGEERVCPSSTEVYNIEPYGGSGFVWTLSGGGTIKEGQGTNRVTIEWFSSPSTATTYWLSVKYDNCYLGCGGQDSIPVKILPSFVVNGPVEVCVAANGVFTAKFTNNNAAINCDWSLTDPLGTTVWNSVAASASESVPFLNGDGYYRLFATPANLDQTCSDQADWSVHVRPLPAKLTGIKGQRKICPATTYTYEAEGGDPQSNYSWTVKNGPAALAYFQGKTLNVTWNASGPRWLSVAHVSSDGLGCQSDTLQIQIIPIGIPDIIGTPSVCEDTKGIYTVEPLGNIDLQWQVSPATAGSVASGQGSNAVEIFWSQAGGHVVNVNVCGQTSVFPVTVNAPPEPIVQAPNGLCPGSTDLVQTTTPFSDYSWTNEAGAVVANTATTMLLSGTYAVEVTDANGCLGSKEFFIEQWDKPDVSLTTASPTGFCNNSITVPLTALINADGNYTFQWYKDGTLLPGQTASTYSTNQYGYYTVEATNAHNCKTVAGPIRLFLFCGGGGGGSLPCDGSPCPSGTVDLAIDPTARCDSFQMHLLDPNGVYMPGTAKWIVGISGGVATDTSTNLNPTFTMDNAGEYVAILQVELTDGTVCNVHDFFGVEAVSRFKMLPDCPGESSYFQDVSEFLPSGGIANWSWDFGDPGSGANNQSILRNEAHTYSPSGNYTVQLTVTGNSGCTSTASETVVIPVLPNVSFADPATNCAGNALQFAAPPNPAGITHLTWDFGDPASGAANDALGNPSYHSFTPAGSYSVMATATNIYGCTATFSKSVVVVPNTLSGNITPMVPPAICEGKTISLGAPGGATSYLWSDDNASTTPFLIVGEEGSYQVTMTDANGCTYTPPAVNVEMNVAPDATIKALLFNDLNQVVGVSYPTLAVCAGEDVVLNTVSNTSVNYSWSVVNGNNPFLYFTEDRNNLLSVGNHLYTVTVTNPATGCTAVSSPFSVMVNPVPSGFSISGTTTCAGNSNTLTYAGPQPANWNMIWNTGLAGTTLTTDEPGVYQIRVINEFGCEARSNPWTVLPGPPVSSIPAGCHTRCKPDTLCLPILPTVTAWQWFLDGSPIPGATTADFVAQQSGTYWAQLTDLYGCTNQSGPLTLNLYDGYGNILGQVWSDVNNNGVIDAVDTLVSGIPVLLYQNGTLSGGANSGPNGDFSFPNVLSTNYAVEIDAASLPPTWSIVIGTDPVSLSGCGVEGNADLLLHFGCQAPATLQLSGCTGTTVTYEGTAIPVGGTQTFHYTSVQGCDSTLVVSVAALQTSTGTATLQACPGGTASYAGTNIPVGTTQNFTLTNWLGCDSIVTVSVQAWPTSTGTATLQACPGGTASYAGTNVPVGTTQNFTLTNWLGCDSIVTVSVQAWPTSTGTATLHACPGSTANYAGTDVPVGTTQNFTLSNWLGCDSIVTVNVLAWPTSTGSATFLFACSGGSATYNGTSIPAGSSQQFTLQTWHGCDSLVTVSVAPLPPATGVANLFACPGGAATYSGTSVPVGTSQNFTLTNWLGCDSIVTVNVQAWPTSTGAQTLHACSGGTANYAGTDIPVGTSQDFNLPNWLGCDSTVTVTVAQWPASSGVQTLHACPGGTANFAGTDIPVGTSQNFTLSNWLGCDSIVAVTVQPWVSTNSSFETSVCPGETFMYQGVALSGGTVQPFILPNWLGCDSTVTVTVKQLNASTNVLEVSICPGATFQFQGAEISGGGSQDFHLSNAEGCDSTLTVVVQEFPAATFAVQAQRACAHAPTGSLEAIADPGGQPPFQFSLNKTDYQNASLFSNLDAGNYTVYLEDANGCIFEQETAIPAIPALELRLADGVLACDSTLVTLVPAISGGDSASLKVSWWDGSTGNSAVATDAGSIWVEATDICGTKRSEAKVEWAELADDFSIVYVPNVMKPSSSDPANAQFRPLFASGITLLRFKFMVFDRWGTEIFQTENTTEGWDGILNAKNIGPGVQVWYLEADVSMCGRVVHLVKKGDVTVVR